MNQITLSMCIRQIRMETADTTSFEFTPIGDAALPAFSPGAHVNIQIPGGPLRSYSLLNASNSVGSYCIAVKRESESRGGSSWFHEQARVGMHLKLSQPMNDFELVEDAPLSVLMAGGIGITPLLSMIERLTELQRPWQLHYSARTPEQMAFSAVLERYAQRGFGEIHRYYSGNNLHRMDVAAIVTKTPAEAHLYCCGPTGLIDAFEAAGKNRHAETLHFERFAAAQAAATQGGFEIELVRSGRTLSVSKGKSILDVLLDAGVNMQYACTQGVCGTCITGVLSGLPDHRDDCLSDEEKSSNKKIITCCSGSLSPVLALDL